MKEVTSKIYHSYRFLDRVVMWFEMGIKSRRFPFPSFTNQTDLNRFTTSKSCPIQIRNISFQWLLQGLLKNISYSTLLSTFC